VENGELATLDNFQHPQRVIYLLGAEDEGIPSEILKNHRSIEIKSPKKFCLNVAVAGSIVMYDRFIKNGQIE
jgi:tRNA G18 (ribose-2'-O)-methylase SpoU